METSKLMEGRTRLFNNYKTTYINSLNLTEIKTRKMNMDVTLCYQTQMPHSKLGTIIWLSYAN